MSTSTSNAPSAACKLRTSVLICLACIVEGADMAMLPSVYLYISRSLQASPSQLGVMTLCRALTQALSSPASGMLADRYDRTLVVASGAALWSACTVGVSASHTLLQACVFTALNGLGLALVIPCAQSIVADYYPAEQRGRAFGAMQLTMSLGSMVGGLFATNIAPTRPFGIEGWRFAMRSISLLSFSVGAAVALAAEDPRPGFAKSAPLVPRTAATSSATTAAIHKRPPAGAAAVGDPRGEETLAASLRDTVRDISHIVSIPSFQIIIAQGIVGTMPWNAIAFLTLWLQLLGFSDWSASVLTAAFYGASSAGAFLGGFLGDVASRWSPNSGRVYTAQISAFLGLPLSVVLILGLPRSEVEAAVPAYLAVILLFGTTISWCGSGCNSPIFAEIVPPELRSLIYAFDRCFEGALAATAAPLVGVIAERGFGYTAPQDGGRGGAAALGAGGGLDRANADALGRSLLWCLVTPWTLCLLFYCGLHWTYPRDRSRLKQRQERHEFGVGPSTELVALLGAANGLDGWRPDQHTVRRSVSGT